MNAPTATPGLPVAAPVAADGSTPNTGVQPVLSVILLSPDTPRTQLTTVGHLRNQTIASQLEVVIVAPSLEGADAFAAENLGDFAGHRFVQSPPDNVALGVQHALGVFAASAPLVAFGEDHCAPAPDWAERLVEAFARPEGYAGIGVAMHNANPGSALSWGNLVIGYLNWVAPVPAGEADYIPGSNASYRRDLLLPFGDKLGSMLDRGGNIQSTLRQQGHRFYIEPRAKVYHKNVSRLSSTFGLRFSVGQFLAARKVQDKQLGWPARILHLLLAPLEPALRFAKIVKRLRARKYPLTAKLILGTAVGLSFDVAGLVAGYLIGMGDARRRVYLDEFHRERHMLPHERGRNAVAENHPDVAASPRYKPVPV